MRIIENPIFGAYLYGASYDSETKKVMIRVPKPFFFSVIPFTIKGESISKDDDNNSTPARSLTDSEKSIIMSNIAGDYEGKLYYIKTDQKEDSIRTAGRIKLPTYNPYGIKRK